MFVCFLSPPENSSSRWTGDFWSKSVLLILPKLEDFFSSSWNVFNYIYFNLFFWPLRTSLLCILGELAGSGSVAVAVGVSDGGAA